MTLIDTEISFRKLLDSTVQVQFDPSDNSYILKTSPIGGGGPGPGGDGFIYGGAGFVPNGQSMQIGAFGSVGQINGANPLSGQSGDLLIDLGSLFFENGNKNNIGNFTLHELNFFLTSLSGSVDSEVSLYNKTLNDLTTGTLIAGPIQVGNLSLSTPLNAKIQLYKSDTGIVFDENTYPLVGVEIIDGVGFLGTVLTFQYKIKINNFSVTP